MPLKTEKDYDITVTSATQTAAQVATDLGLEAEPPAVVVPPVVEGTPPADATVTDFEKKLDELEPPTKADETPEEKTERRSRSQSKILKEIALRKQAEDRATDLQRQLDQARKTPAPPVPPPATADAPIADGTKSAQDFDFPTFDDWQEKHPEGDLRDYSVALSDARDDWRSVRKANADAQATAHREQTEALTTFKSATDTFKADHADYDTVLDAIALPPNVVDPVTKEERRDPLVLDLERLVVQAGKDGPAILYYLGTHKAEADRVTAAKNPMELHLAFGEIRGTVRAQQANAPAIPAEETVKPATPVLPKTPAPAPTTPIPAGGPAARTAADIGNKDDDDADEYIAQRQSELRQRQRTG